MADYTAYPPFISQSVSPNILFVVDLSEAMLPVAYGSYPLFYSPGEVYASNYKGAGLAVTTTAPGASSSASLVDLFDPAIGYYGLFDSVSCYTAGDHQFEARVPHGSLATPCADG